MKVEFTGKVTRYNYERKLDAGTVEASFSEGNGVGVSGTTLSVAYVTDEGKRRIPIGSVALGDDIEKALPEAEGIVETLITLKAWEGLI